MRGALQRNGTEALRADVGASPDTRGGAEAASPNGFPPGLFAWYAPGFSDPLGDRLLLFDNTEGRPLELLRLCEPIARTPDSELLLRARAERLTGLDDLAFARVHRVDRLPDPGGGLAIVSEHVEGQRLSDFLAIVHQRGGRLAADLALGVVSKLTAAISAIHRLEPQLAHGALAPERLVVAPGGRVIVTEYVLGSVLPQVPFDRETLWRRLHVAVAPGPAAPAFDQRADVLQMGVVALALLVGRPLAADEYPSAVPDLLEQAGRRAAEAGWDGARWQAFHAWLARALCLEPESGFDNAMEAADALEPLHPREGAGGWDVLGSDGLGHPRLTAPDSDRTRRPHSPSTSLQRARWRGHARPQRGRLPTVVLTLALCGGGLYLTGRTLTRSTQRPPMPSTTAVAAAADARTTAGDRGAEAATLDVRSDPPGARVFIDGQPRGVTPFAARGLLPGPHQLRVESGGRSIAQVVTMEAGRAATLFVPFAGGDAPSAGWVSIASAVELQIYEAGRFLGTSRADRIMLPAGRHQVSLVNDAIGYRAARDVQVPIGKTASLDVSLPNGRADINAAPWAEVWIDGEKAGDTPLAAFALSPGRHTVTFKHPRLGERSVECFVTLEQPLRLSADLRK